ncbi:MAG TPA: HdeA/HdeB family chaperone [Myxococcaceae bacterium]|nr:HdeA/HdeB family chaperone [Myxococcaceae bacterium]
MRSAPLLLVATALATSAAAQTPPSPASPQARVVDIEHLSCSQYLALPEADRGLVLWYAAGYYKAAGNSARRFDLDAAAKAPDAVAKQCGDKPGASFRYTLKGVFSPAKK